jgi:hypothetical protein
VGNVCWKGGADGVLGLILIEGRGCGGRHGFGGVGGGDVGGSEHGWVVVGFGFGVEEGRRGERLMVVTIWHTSLRVSTGEVVFGLAVCSYIETASTRGLLHLHSASSRCCDYHTE